MKTRIWSRCEVEIRWQDQRVPHAQIRYQCGPWLPLDACELSAGAAERLAESRAKDLGLKELDGLALEYATTEWQGD